jgi:glycoside transferase family 2
MTEFSVLLSVYYHETVENIQQALQSIINQTVSPYEIILIKDGPLSKELDSIIEEYSYKHDFIKIIYLPKNVGLGKALNKGLEFCTCDIIARMDTDDIAKPNRFERQLQIFENNPDLDLVGAWIDEFEGNIENILSIRKVPEYHLDIYKFAKRRSPINHPVAMFKKSAVLAVGGYKHFPLFEDYYLWVRMLMNNAIFYNIQESLLYFRYSSDVIKRRGGWNYAINEYKLQKEFRNIGFINNIEFIENILIRFIPRILPNTLRSIIYKIIRKKRQKIF